MTNQISQYVHKRFFYRIFRSQFRSTQKLEKSSQESLLLPQLLGGESDSKQSDEFQATASFAFHEDSIQINCYVFY